MRDGPWDYNKDVIAKGDAGSRQLQEGTFETLRYSPYIDLSTGYPVVRVPAGYKVIVHGAFGKESERLDDHARSLVEQLVDQAYGICAIPVGFANIISTSRSDAHSLSQVITGLHEGCEKYKVGVLNGENAVLGDRVVGNGNISGVMVSIIPQRFFSGQVGVIESRGQKYSIFNPQGKPVFINCDGVGTKTEFYERRHMEGRAVDDLLAMNLDDTSKKGAQAQVVVGLLEHNWNAGTIPQKVAHQFKRRMKELGIMGVVESKDVNWRIEGYHSGKAFNLDGAVVSTIDEERLKNPLQSSAGDHLIAIWGAPNPRSNGITLRRRIMEDKGHAWHYNKQYQDVRDFLSTPSTIFYPVFERLIQEELVTNVTHLSGGSWKGKVAVPLAAQELYVSVTDLPALCGAERKLAAWSGKSAEALYESWPMGVEGLVSAQPGYENKAIDMIRRSGLNACVVGQLVNATPENSGVRLQTFNGEEVYFSGRVEERK